MNRDKEWDKLLALTSPKKIQSNMSVLSSLESPRKKRGPPRKSTNIFASLDFDKLIGDKTKEGIY